MNLCRFRTLSQDVAIGLVIDGVSLVDLTPAGITRLAPILESENPLRLISQLGHENFPKIPLSAVQLCAPIERQEVWAAGVTYLRSKNARMEESEFSASAYDKVYAAARPELFFKSIAEKVVPAGETIGIRRDAKWNVPEPELALVINSKGKIVGTTIGNDMSSRDIEGENLLYLPQAKIYDRSCALGPWITIGATESEVRTWGIQIEIRRAKLAVFSGKTSVANLKRGFDELAEYLFRSQTFPHGAVLLTGTGVVPDESFTLQSGDDVEIRISGIGSLRNTVTLV